MNTQVKSSNSQTLSYMWGGVGKHLSFSVLRLFFAIYAAQDCFLLRFFYCPLERGQGAVIPSLRGGAK